MEQIIAALILSCSNLAVSGNINYYAVKEFSEQKAQCVQRVAKCVAPATESYGGDLDRIRAVLKCSKEVRL